jgi:lipid-A-disaccharide synthase
MSAKKIFFSAGDPSGDANCEMVVREIKKRHPHWQLRGLGGPAMQRAGFESLFPFERFNAMGYWEVFKDLPFFLRQKKRFFRLLEKEQPHVLICVDYSGFNRPLMKKARELNIPVLWFIAPMIWAWKRKKHGRFLGRYASHIAVIFPFEKTHWQEFTPAVSFVGNPLYEKALAGGVTSRVFPRRDGKLTIAFVPGSRSAEVRNILPEYIRTYRMLVSEFPSGVHGVVSRAEMLPRALFSAAEKAGMEISEEPLEEVFKKADMAVVQSGTATLQAGFQRIPHVVVYKTSALTYCIIRLLIKNLSYIGLSNILGKKEIVPELLQKDARAENISPLLLEYAHTAKNYERTVADLDRVFAVFDSTESTENLMNLIEKLSHTTPEEL